MYVRFSTAWYIFQEPLDRYRAIMALLFHQAVAKRNIECIKEIQRSRLDCSSGQSYDHSAFPKCFHIDQRVRTCVVQFPNSTRAELSP